jgi:hypothetical protein
MDTASPSGPLRRPVSRYNPVVDMAGELFATAPQLDVRYEELAGKVPVLLVDGFFEDPEAVRQMALALPYEPPPYPYPGRLAAIPESQSLAALLRKVLAIVNTHYLPRVPIAHHGRRITAFPRIYSDFAVVDVHPDELAPPQRKPHRDPVPVFGLVYLNQEARGGTLFFEEKGSGDAAPERQGYMTQSDPDYELAARIEGRFNRLAVYPGFVPHSGEIVGEWIKGDARFNEPRLTQRLVFFP